MSEGAGDSQLSSGASGSDHREQAGEAVPVPASTVTAVGLVPVQAVGSAPASQEGTRLADALGPPLASTPQTTSASRELAADRVFAAATGIVTSGVGGWPAAPGAAASATMALARADGGSLTSTIGSGAPSGGRDDGAAIQNHPSAPLPGSGGAGVGSAAGGGSGGACSASSILFGDLFHMAPVVMRRLCLSQPSWRTASFALILERPD